MVGNLSRQLVQRAGLMRCRSTVAYVPQTVVAPEDGRPIYLDFQVKYFKLEKWNC